MKRNDAEQIGEMIRKFFRQNALEAPLNEYRLIQAWKDVVGPAITKYTSNLYIKNQILYVHLTSSVLRQELMMGRDLLVKNPSKSAPDKKYCRKLRGYQRNSRRPSCQRKIILTITCAPTCLFRFFTNKSRPIINS